MPDTKLFSPESEINVIVGILKSPGFVHNTDGLRFHMFSSTPHQIIYKEFEDLKEQNILPAPQIVIASLESKNLIDAAGGKTYVNGLLNKDINPDEESFKKFVAILVASYKGRSFLSTLSAFKKEDLSA